MEQTDDNAIDLGVNESENEELELDLEESKPEVKPEETIEFWKNRANKFQRKLNENPKEERTLITKKNKDLDDVRSVVSKLELAENKRQFGYEHGLAPDEVDKIFQYNPNPTKEILEDEFIKAGLSALRAKKRVEANTPGSSTSSIKFATKKPLNELSQDEKQREFEAFMKSKRG